jgi:small-conductance mechanosensitive channel
LDFLNTEFVGNSVRAWLIAGALLLSFAAAYALVRRLAAGRIEKLSERTETQLDDALAAAAAATKPALLFFIAVFVASQPLSLPETLGRWVGILATVAALVQVGFWSVGWLDVMLASWRERRLGDDPDASTTFKFVHYALNVLIWAIVLLLLLENLGVDISALVAGLGISGIAVALALQSILGDLFASLTILLDKPFVVDDYLAVDDLSGTVESIGLNTTRLTSLTGEQLVFSNKDLLQSRIRNYGRMEERRVLFRIGVVYGTSPGTLQKIPDMIQTVIEDQDQTRFDRSHFKEFGDSALTFETVYHMTVPDYQAYMDVQQRVNLAVLRSFESEGIEFAFPTQHVYLETVGGADRSGDSTSGPGGDDSVDGPGDDK